MQSCALRTRRGFVEVQEMLSWDRKDFTTARSQQQEPVAFADILNTVHARCLAPRGHSPTCVSSRTGLERPLSAGQSHGWLGNSPPVTGPVNGAAGPGTRGLCWGALRQKEKPALGRGNRSTRHADDRVPCGRHRAPSPVAPLGSLVLLLFDLLSLPPL